MSNMIFDEPRQGFGVISRKIDFAVSSEKKGKEVRIRLIFVLFLANAFTFTRAPNQHAKPNSVLGHR